MKKNTGGQPNLYVKTGRIPGEVQDLNAIVAGGIGTEVWLKKNGDKEFKSVGAAACANEYFLVDVNKYFAKPCRATMQKVTK